MKLVPITLQANPLTTELCRLDKVYYLHNLLPLTYKVWDKVIFSQACLSIMRGGGDRRAAPISSIGGGGSEKGQTPPPGESRITGGTLPSGIQLCYWKKTLSANIKVLQLQTAVSFAHDMWL